MPRPLRLAVLLLGLGAVVFSVVTAWKATAPHAAIDFYQFYVIVELARSGEAVDIYSADAQQPIGEEFFGRAVRSGERLFHETATVRRSLDVRGSPILFTSFAWLSRSYERALVQYRILLFVSLAAGMILLGRYRAVPLWATLFGIAVVSLYFPFGADLTVGNVNAIQFFVLALALAVSARSPAAAGAILATFRCRS